MIFSPSKQLRATLHVGRKDACVFWSTQEQSGSIVFAYQGSEVIPSLVWQSAVLSLRQEIDQHPSAKAILARCRWRLVLPGGFYVVAGRPQGRWTTTLAKAAANELETACPVALDELQTAAIPLGPDTAWVCGFSEAILTKWQQAAQEAKLSLEGVWTQASALIDSALEEDIHQDVDTVTWQDGCVRVELGRTKMDVTSRERAIDRARVYSCRSAPALTGFDTALAPSVIHFPGRAAHQLQEIDPSESLNLLRGLYGSSLLKRQIELPLAAVLFIWAIAMALFALANLASARAAQKQTLVAQEQIASLWHQAQGASLMPPLAVTTLEQQAASWRAARVCSRYLDPLVPASSPRGQP